MKKKYCIVGCGGFGREVFVCLEDFLNTDIRKNTVFMVTSSVVEHEIMGVPVISLDEFDPELYKVVIAVGDPIARKKIAENLPRETEFISIIHPTAVVSKYCEIGKGSIITAGCIVTCNIKLGKHTHLNLHSTIGHDCSIGNYFTTAPGTKISGNCKIGECVYFGTNSSVRQGIDIKDNITVGMGGVVVKNLLECGVYTGVPVKKIK